MAGIKKSNILIAVAVIIASIWTILICWFCATSINNFREGKNLIFARSYRQYLEGQRKRFPTPSDEFIISGDGTTMVQITQGKELSVISNKHIFTCSYIDFKNGRSKVSIKRLYENDNETIKITLPEIRMFSLENCAEVNISGFNRKEMKIDLTGISTFSADNCRVGSFCLEFLKNQHDYEIWIQGTNRLDSLSVSTQGKGKLKLDGIGKYKNRLWVSDSVQIITRGDLYNQLTIVSPAQTGTK